MRITNSTLLRNYDRNLKRISTAKYSSENKIYSGRQYTRASQSPLKAAKALTVRKQLWHTEQYKENLNVADKFYTEAETSLLQISDSLANVRETIIYACNSTKDESVDLNILAEQLETKAKEMVSIFNTDSAERAIFGGESNSAEPFTLQYDEDGRATTVLYHGVPVNAMSDASGYPYSKDVYIDIGIGMVINDNQEIDPQSALKISFIGTDVTGCGYESSDEKQTSINLKSLKYGVDQNNTLRLNVDGNTYTISFKGNKVEDIQKAITDKLTAAGVAADKIPTVGEKGGLTMKDNTIAYVSEDPYINLENLVDGKAYSFDIYTNGAKKTINFVAGADSAESMANIQAKMDEEFKNGDTYSNNYIQVTLDAAAALRRGDIGYANACIDRIVTSSENLLVEIADLGNAEEYIEFNTSRFETRELNLKDRQKTLEATDLESEITLMKTYEAIYNAALQMSSSIIPNSIFNYIK